MSNNTRLRYACYATNCTMAVVGNLPPILFITFRELYGISYSLLGLLVLTNFCTQLTVDLIFSFFSHKFNIPKAVKFTPVLGAIGLLLFAAAPILFPSAVYVGLVLGTIVFSASSGFAEVLISPVIAAIPAENPEREMSKLHAVYAWGAVVVIVLGTLFLFFLDGTYWQLLVLLSALIPLTAAALFAGTRFPPMETPERVSGVMAFLKEKALWLSVVAISLGGAAECTMAQWCSGYLETAVAIPKIWGDIFGAALFAMTLGLGRTLYAKYGQNIEKILFLGSLGAAVCYPVAALSGVPVVGLLACAFTGFCVSMLWPGNLVVAADRFPHGGVFLYAMMAAGGDLGASVGPQLVGVVTDAVAASSFGIELAARFALLPEQLGMKCGLLVGAAFPLAAVFVCGALLKRKKKA